MQQFADPDDHATHHLPASALLQLPLTLQHRIVLLLQAD
jgi:hypothetical protein